MDGNSIELLESHSSTIYNKLTPQSSLVEAKSHTISTLLGSHEKPLMKETAHTHHTVTRSDIKGLPLILGDKVLFLTLHWDSM